VSPDADLAGPVSGKGKIDTYEVDRYVRRHVFDLKNPDSILKRLESARSGRLQQTPIYVPARAGTPDALVLRSLN
jgi:hypothetical protein